MIHAIRYCTFALLLVFASHSQSEALAIVGATIIDGNGGEPINNGVLVMAGDNITAVGDRHTPIPPAARRINASGKTLIPGLMNAGVQLFHATQVESLIRYEQRYEAIITEAAQLSLKHGVTTVFDRWGPRQALSEVRERINTGSVPGSRLYLAGNLIGTDGPLSADFVQHPAAVAALSQSFVSRTNAQWTQGVARNLLWHPPAQVKQALRAYLAKGIDFIHYTASGLPPNEQDFHSFSPAVQRVLVAEARAAGLTVQSHSTSAHSLAEAIAAGVDIAQDCARTGLQTIAAATLQLMRERQVACAPQPFISAQQARPSDPRQRVNQHNIQQLIQADVPLLLATGANTLPQLTEGHFAWLKAMHELGMPAMAGLQAATRNIARAYGVDGDLGTLEAGKRADMLILEQNPLNNPDHYRQIYRVIKGGKIIHRDGLPKHPLLSTKTEGGR